MNSFGQVSVSVIVPVFNVDKLLNKCLDSIAAQTYDDFEVLLIDDGSKDLSGTICDEYASRHGNMHAYHQENGGVVSARNYGTRLAKGRYFTFVDADDWVEPDFLQRFIDNMEKYDADIVITGYCKDTKDKEKREKNHIEAGVYEGESLIPFYRSMLQYNTSYEFGVQPFLVNKIFKRELFIECSAGLDPQIYEAEDAAIVFPYLLHSQRIVVTEDCPYHYVYRKSSATNERKFNYFENISRLFLYLNRKFQETEYYDIMLPQMGSYMRMLIYIENPDAFLEEGKYMFPFRKVPVDSRIILYGAGHVGRVYRHQIELSKYCRLTAWADAAYSREELRQSGIVSPDSLMELDYDLIVIAIENKETVSTVKKMLIEKGIPEERIVAADGV